MATFSLFDTVAQAMSGIVYATEKKETVSITFSIYGVFLFLIFSVLPRSAFPSIAMFIPFVFRIPVIHSINARQKISSSMFPRILDTVAGDAIPFSSSRCCLKKSM